MHDPETGTAARRLYQDAMERAVREASRTLPWDAALEVAHEVASELVQRGAAGPDDPDDRRSFDALIRRAVAFRVRDVWRAARRRAAAESVHHQERSTTPAWAEPGARIEAEELERVIADAVAAMPQAMREVFLLIRQDALSYKEVAERLAIGVGTVHTQLSRASARLREAVERYRAGDGPSRSEPRPTTSANGA